MQEIAFGGLPGPTHNYAGLARGNVAAQRHACQLADPRDAALQALDRMRALAARGFPQAVLPPHERPCVPALRALGFRGRDADVIARAAREAPRLLAACSSASAMWAANAATVSASSDTADGRLHLTPANLIAHFHRSIESDTTTRVLDAMFADPDRFVVHRPLPAAHELADEGAANHTRLGDDGRAVHLFVYGRDAFDEAVREPHIRHPARQSRQACEAIARRHGLDPALVVLARQSPQAIDAGVFHNDVIAVGSGTVLLLHEHAYVGQPAVLAALDRALAGALVPIVVEARELTLEEAVECYLFNSELLRRSDGRFLLAAPEDCMRHPRASAWIASMLARGGPIADVVAFDLRQSMRNGGGPACLRLRVPMTDAERAAIGPQVFLTDALADALERWIRRHYRDRLAPNDLSDPALLDESRRALDELGDILRMPPIHPFQLAGA